MSNRLIVATYHLCEATTQDLRRLDRRQTANLRDQLLRCLDMIEGGQPGYTDLRRILEATSPSGILHIDRAQRQALAAKLRELAYLAESIDDEARRVDRERRRSGVLGDGERAP